MRLLKIKHDQKPWVNPSYNIVTFYELDLKSVVIYLHDHTFYSIQEGVIKKKKTNNKKQQNTSLSHVNLHGSKDGEVRSDTSGDCRVIQLEN